MISTHTSLLLRLRTNEDSAAWGQFVRLYTPLLFHWVRKLGIESNRADDLVQEIFLVLLAKMPRLAEDRPKSFRAWLRTLTLNKCRDWFRQQKNVSNPRLIHQIECAVDDPTTLLTEQEYRAFVAQAALRLMRDAFNETTWRACWEHVACGRPARDVAAELGISENAVYLARGRVLKRLRIELDGLWEE